MSNPNWIEEPDIPMREAIVVLAEDAASNDASNKELEAIVARLKASLRPLFRDATNDDSIEKPGRAALKREMAAYRTIEAPETDLDEIADALRESANVEAIYYKPAAAIPPLGGIGASVVPFSGAPAVATPNLVPHQAYLGPAATGGIDARHAWTVAGGDGGGTDVRVIDLEFSWDTAHEDRPRNLDGVVIGSPAHDTTHGTMVMGVVAANPNGLGMTGICPLVRVGLGAFPASGGALAPTIAAATRLSKPGDILLVEVELAGPKGVAIPIEWWRDNWLAIRDAVDHGVIVIEAAGNGNDDLNDPVYDIPLAGFPPTWRNPFRRALADSGAIIVGAGAPPSGTHGVTTSHDRSRMPRSNFGDVVDVQGWGDRVATTGGGDLQNRAPVPHRRYTRNFPDTSAAAAMIAGVLACVQSARKRAGRPLLDSIAARDMFLATGGPQQAAPGRPVTERIGNRPDLRELQLRGFY